MDELVLANALIKLTGDSCGLSAQLKDVEQQLGRSVTSMEQNFVVGFRRGIDQAGTGVEMLGSRLGGLAQVATSPLAATAAGVLAVGVAIDKSISKAKDFEAAFANVSTLWNSSAKEISDMKAQVLALNPALGDSTELVNGLYEALSAGVDPAKGVQFVGDAAKLARAGLASTKEVVDLLTTSLNAYGLGAEHTTRISDILYKTVEQGKTTVPELARSLGMVIPFAANLNISFEELGAVMATLTKGGLATDIAATALRGTLAGLIQESDKFKAEGIEILKVVKEEGLTGAFRALNQVSKGNMELVRSLVPDTKALTAVLALTGKQSDELAKQKENMKNASGATEIAIKKQMDSLKGDLTILANMWTQVAIAVGEKFLPPARHAVQMLTMITAVSKETWNALSRLSSWVFRPRIQALASVVDIQNEFAEAFQQAQAANAENLGVAGGRGIRPASREETEEEIQKRIQLGAEQRKVALEASETEWKATEARIKQRDDLRQKILSSDKAVAEAGKASALELMQYDKALVFAKLQGLEELRKARMEQIRKEMAILTGNGVEELAKRRALEQELTTLAIQGSINRGEAEAQFRVILAREIQERLRMEDQYWQSKNALGQIGVQQNIDRLRTISQDERRGADERIKAAQEAFAMAKQWTDKLFEFRTSIGLNSLQAEIDHYSKIASAANRTAEEQMAAAQKVYDKENELRNKRREAATKILEEVQARLGERGITEASQADIEREFQLMQNEKMFNAQTQIGRFNQGYRVDLNMLGEAFRQVGEINEAAKSFSQLGSMGEIFQGAGQIVPGSPEAMRQMGLGWLGQAPIGRSLPGDQMVTLRETLEPIKAAFSEGLETIENQTTATIDRILQKIDTGASRLSESLLEKFKREFPGMLEAELNRS